MELMPRRESKASKQFYVPKKIITKKLIIVIHCRDKDNKPLEHAYNQTKIAVDNGADGVFLILHHRDPKNENLIKIYHHIRSKFPDLFIGINFLKYNVTGDYE